MTTHPAKTNPVRLCAWTALSGCLVTALLPVVFFRFPGPQFMPFRYESMWAVTEVLWGPLRMLQTGLTPLVGYDLRQHVNPYYAAPLVNGPMALAAVAAFLTFRNAWRRRAQTAEGPHLGPVAERIQELRADYPAALREVPHPSPHAEARVQDARAKLANQPFLKREPESQAPERDEEDV